MTDSPMRGSLHAVPLLETFSLVASYRKSGALVLRTPMNEVTIYFDYGAVRCVSTNVDAMRIGEVLMELGLVTEEQIEQALALQSVADDPDRLGEVLVDVGYISENDINQAIAQQIQSALVSLLKEPHGIFEFSPQRPSGRAEFAGVISFEPLVLNATYLADRWLAEQHPEHQDTLPDTILDDGILDWVSTHERDLLRNLISTYNQLHSLAWRYGEAAQQVKRSVERLLQHVLMRIAEGRDDQLGSRPARERHLPPPDYRLMLLDVEINLWSLMDLTRNARVLLLYLLNGESRLSAMSGEYSDVDGNPDRAVQELVSAGLIATEIIEPDDAGGGQQDNSGRVSGGSGLEESPADFLNG
jgi:hypothetical protein